MQGAIMDVREHGLFERMRTILGSQYHKILAIDIDSDWYEVLTVADSEWEKKKKENPSDKISQWFAWFADGPFCYEADRERFKEFTDLEHLRYYFLSTNYETASIVYRRKYNLSDQLYNTVVMEIYPEVNEDGHLTALLCVRNLTSQMHKQHKLIQEGLVDQDGSYRGRKTILIVEDNELNRELLEELLSDKYHILSAENGKEGLVQLQKHLTEISLVVLDVEMPVMNGYEFLTHVMKDPLLSEIPVVVATSSNSTLQEWRCLQLGAVDFVSKPYHRDIIRSRIASIIKLRESKATVAMLQTDERTGLFTLQAFYHYAKHEINQAEDRTFAVTILDVENYRTLSEIYGDQTGNKLVREVADLLKEYCLAAKSHGRFGAARFYLLHTAMSNLEMESWIKTLFARIEDHCSIKGIRLKAGIYTEIDKHLPITEVCNHATSALNTVLPNAVKRYALYDQEQEAKELRMGILEADLQKAFKDDQFLVYYQPKHDAHTEKLIGAEALIRWNHPAFGFLSPGEFIPLFERNGFISSIDEFVLCKTCENLRHWLDEGIAPVPVSINISRLDFEREGGMANLIRILKENELDPGLIHIEVTETHFSDRMEKMSQELLRCREAGVQVELDDFGSGYSSLNMLASLPMDVMKLDMSFMKNFKDEKKRKVLSTCIGLAHNLGMKTISEGVETEEQLELLRRFDCDWIQGYYFSKPLSEADYKAYLINQSKIDK